MVNYLSALLVLCLAVAVNGFIAQSPSAFSRGFVARSVQSTSQVGRTSVSSRSAVATRTIAPAGLRMAAQAKAPTKNFWEGEWVCADCGYIYDVEDCGGIFLEEQKRGFVCPQCRGPRRRFAKKVGDQVGITQDGGDAPILLFSFLGLAGTVAFGFWFAGQ